uniref:(northern house mosquito) hypothetical protein n=1 Tax=Culex pipiens TaxID=7175 RepID=A0A8D8P9P9_CULPI
MKRAVRSDVKYQNAHLSVVRFSAKRIAGLYLVFTQFRDIFFLSHSPATERSHKSHHKINFSNAVLVPDPSRWFPNPRVLSCRFSEKTTEWEVSVYEEKRRIHRKRMLSGKKREFASYRYGHYTL